jgi:hypothetical protein
MFDVASRDAARVRPPTAPRRMTHATDSGGGSTVLDNWAAADLGGGGVRPCIISGGYYGPGCM